MYENNNKKNNNFKKIKTNKELIKKSNIKQKDRVYFKILFFCSKQFSKQLLFV